ncbi:MAG: phosphomethylpyrimidine synthase ThiC [Candidatus Omnitrophota bacterium]|nr:MAG: phosphomethylpyrimidine synthase ThiC [Candidatus Omnitrophota bacterium]
MFKKSFLKDLAKKEKVKATFLEKQLEKGRVVIPLNRKREIPKPIAIGEGLKIKINANIGASTEETGIKDEIEKLKTAIEAGTDTVMDLTIGENLKKVRKEILKNCEVALGTVPIYEAAIEAEKKRGSFEKMTFDDIWGVLKSQAEQGVDFFTIHAGILKKALTTLKKKKRVGGIVSRGGAILARWMDVNKKENPLYGNFDKILELAKEYRMTLSLGDALRPGAIADSSDTLQMSELYVLGELVKKCRKKGVQVMVEGPGHIRLDEIALNMFLEKKICSHAPFYVLGPLPTDIAAGYDHITGAIGGTLAAFYGADFLCVVTPAEHLRHPSVQDIKEGVIASRIAAHSVDVLRFKDEWQKDLNLSLARAHRDWGKIFPLTLDEQKAKRYKGQNKTLSDICTMCGRYCSLKMLEKCNLLK